MEVFTKLVEFGKRQSFQPNISSIFINPFFLLRRRLYRAIKDNASLLEGRLLDFGCGRKPYKNLFTVDEYIGVDIKKSGHSHEESEVDIFYDGSHIPVEDEYFDSLFSSEVFEHVFNIDEVLTEINRVMKKGGVGLITVPFAWQEHEAPYDYGRYTSFGIKYLLEKNGFKVIQQKKTGHFSEVLFQQFIMYIYSLFSSENRILNTIFTLIFISPFNFLGFVLSALLPQKEELYHNNVILLTKE